MLSNVSELTPAVLWRDAHTSSKARACRNVLMVVFAAVKGSVRPISTPTLETVSLASLDEFRRLHPELLQLTRHRRTQSAHLGRRSP